MLSPADVIIIGAFALIVFGPEQLPKVARRAGQVVRDVQNTSQTFIREMERAADAGEHEEWTRAASPVEHYADPTPAPGEHAYESPIEYASDRPVEKVEIAEKADSMPAHAETVSGEKPLGERS